MQFSPSLFSNQDASISRGRSLPWLAGLFVTLCGLPLFAQGTPPPQTLTEERPFYATPARPQSVFGVASDIEGARIVAGAPNWDIVGDAVNGENAGRIFFFRKNGSSWFPDGSLQPQGSKAFQFFGHDIELEGNRLAVGAPGDDRNSAPLTLAGAAFIFEHDGSQWIQVAKLIASDADGYENLGASLSLDGDRMLVGAPNEDRPGTGQQDNVGAAYLYMYDGSTWPSTKLTTPAPDEGDFFGAEVALDGDRALIAAAGDDDAGDDAGAVYAYVYSAAQGWQQTQKLVAGDASAGDFFGSDVKLSGNRAVISAAGKNGEAGAAYVFTFDGANWNETAVLTTGEAAPDTRFGSEVALGTDRIYIGAGEADGAQPGSGAVYVFDYNRQTGAWVESAKLIASDGATDDGFGRGAISVDGTTLLIGAPQRAMAGSGPFAGTVYLFDLPANWAPFPDSGPSQSFALGKTATLDGTGSYDIEGDPLSYRWSVVSAPDGSTARIMNPQSVTPTFTPDVAGTYRLQLLVDDRASSDVREPDTVEIRVTGGVGRP